MIIREWFRSRIQISLFLPFRLILALIQSEFYIVFHLDIVINSIKMNCNKGKRHECEKY